MSKLFEKLTLGDIELMNRIIMAPMSRNRATDNGCATVLMADYYSQRASAGLIISEGIQPSVVGQGFMNSPGLHTAEQIASWKPVTDGVHKAGGKIVAQLMHSGRIGHPTLYSSAHQSVGPSAIAAKGQAHTPQGMLDYPVPAVLTQKGIEQTIEDFIKTARNAIAAGFDGVEIHAGNGFLLHQFLADNTNQRTDNYGGNVSARSKFVIDLVNAVADVIGNAKMGIRISPSNPYNDIVESDSSVLYQHFISCLPELAFLHIMEANNRNQTRNIRKQWQGGLIVNPHENLNAGAVTPENAKLLLDNGIADAVSFGTLYLANPDLTTRIKLGGPYNGFDESKFYGGDHRGYTDYPTLPKSE